MNRALGGLHARTASAVESPRLLGIFATWRLQAYGYTLAVFYAAFFVYLYALGLWLLDRSGVPVYHDFTYHFVGGLLALQGHAASIYIPTEFAAAQSMLTGAGHHLFTVWPYPPTDLLILAPLAMLPYIAAFLTWQTATLFGIVAVVYCIVRRLPAPLPSCWPRPLPPGIF